MDAETKSEMEKMRRRRRGIVRNSFGKRKINTSLKNQMMTPRRKRRG